MSLHPYRDEELNHFKCLSLVLNEFPKALRQTFKTMWDSTIGHGPGFQLWDDSTAVRNLFVSTEGGTTKVPTHQSYNEWDCTALFQATIFAKSFSKHSKTLADFYVKPCAVPHGSFHGSVLSPVGDNDESFALAIDQLRRLRNAVCHSSRLEMDIATFHRNIQYAKEAFKALGISTAPIDAIGSLTASDFPTTKVRLLEQRAREEIQAYITCLESRNADMQEIRDFLTGIKQNVETLSAKKDDVARLEQMINDGKTEQRECNLAGEKVSTRVAEDMISPVENLRMQPERDKAAQLDEAAATQGNPFPLASADVNLNFPISQPFSQRPLNIQSRKVDENEDMSPLKNKQAVPEKCKFWPQCKNGDSCPFYHPTVACRSFPNCKFGEACKFIHPPCKYDERCTKSACPYTHKLRSKLQTSPVSSPVSGFMFPSPSVLVPSSPSVAPIPCKFYPSCTKVDCPFYHPQRKPCRFGVSCTRPNCLFSHPAKPLSSECVSPSLHISERRFALSEQKKANGEPPVRSLSTGEESEERAIVLPCELVESLSCQSSYCKQVVSQFKENLLCSEASLANPDVETKALIRRFTRLAKCFDRLDVVQHLREITPAGTTGPVLPENLQIQDMSSQQRTDLTVALTVADRWQLVAEKFGLNRDRIDFLNSRYTNPADALLVHITRQRPLTVGFVYDLLCECELQVIADKL